tara:strand:+ start:7933 stop:8322 length:390 start_codon:yes stop_codon:yes gene_type:complete
MKYLYYTLYIFYTKTIKIQNYDTPHFNISLVLGTLQGLWVFILLNTLKLILTSKLNEASWLIFVLIFLFSILNWYYYKSISKRLIKRINSKTKIKKKSIIINSAVIIIVGIILAFYSIILLAEYGGSGK